MTRQGYVRSRPIRQGITEESLFSVLADWCRTGAGHKGHTLQILSAFASGSGVLAITPLLDVFLADGNTVEIIIGIDVDGTDKAALRHLYSLAEAYHEQCSVRVFHAPSRKAIFHPKLYVFRGPKSASFVIGSANLTSGGLGTNFESLLYFPEQPLASAAARHAVAMWEVFASPKPPLKSEYLRELSRSYLVQLLKRLPDQNPHEVQPPLEAVRDLWRPLSGVPLPRSARPGRAVPAARAVVPKAYLLMDVLRETRSTQMQIPLDVVEEFFKVSRRKPATLSVSIWTESGLSQPIERTLVISQGPKRRRLMRRLEMPQIRGLARPLAVLFVRLGPAGRFAFRLIPRHSKSYKAIDRLLERYGQQGMGQRRFIVSRRGESREVAKAREQLLPARGGHSPVST